MQSKNVYIGVFPPPYGGITVKNVLLCDLISKQRKLEIINLLGTKHRKKLCFFSFLRAIYNLCFGRQIIYGLDSKRLKLIMRFHRFFKKSLTKTVVIAMGGVFPEKVDRSSCLKHCLLDVKVIFVETEGMKTQLEQMGFGNVEIFPNPKPEKGACEPKKNETEPLKLVYFSQISEEKGIADIMQLSALLNHEPSLSYQLDFYGHIVPTIEEQFMNFIKTTENVSYQGIFDSTKVDVYKKLNEYDILLFPTHWTTEGVPGILVEAKMAGLAVIASAVSHNLELVREEQNEGVIIRDNYPKEMAEIIQKCDRDRMFLDEIKKGSYNSRKRYSLEEYERIVIEKLD